MQVTIRHREEAGGALGRRHNYFVDCQVEFSEEEKAIISARQLGSQYALTLPSGLPYYVGVVQGGLSSGILQTLSRLCVIATPILFIWAGITGSNGIGFVSLVLPFIAVGIFIYRKVSEKQADVALTDQVIPLSRLMQSPAFTVYAVSSDEASDHDALIRTRFAELNEAIMRNAQVRQMEKFEI